ncbi:MAG TPA: hypothetical protein PK910_05695, partial [Bacteroidales bacterium]|nr:hypothetical protein [Bacteroidales bacterium]
DDPFREVPCTVKFHSHALCASCFSFSILLLQAAPDSSSGKTKPPADAEGIICRCGERGIIRRPADDPFREVPCTVKFHSHALRVSCFSFSLLLLQAAPDSSSGKTKTSG